MAREPSTKPAVDERLARLGREWFAEVRRNNPDEPKTRTVGRDGEGGDGILDALFGDEGDGGDAGD